MKKFNGMRAFFLLRCMVPVLLFAVFPQLLQPQETANHTITSVEINGLWRTKKYIAELPLQKFIGRDSTSLDLNEVNAAVRDTGILEPKSIELVQGDDGVTLLVTVIEKWTIIPIPIFAGDFNDYSMGMYLSDSNFLGIRDMAMLGGVFGTSGWLATAAYYHTPSQNDRPGWNAFFMYGLRNRADTDRNLILYRLYSIYMLRSSIGLFFPLANYLSGSVSLSYTDITLADISNAFNPPENGAMLLGISPGIGLRRSSWDGILLSQKSLSFSYSYQIGMKNPSYHTLALRGVFQQSFIPGFRMELRTGLSYRTYTDKYTDPLFEDSPSMAQVDILPSNYIARNYAGFAAGFEKYLFAWSWGTVTVAASWQAVLAQGPIPGVEFNNGPAASIRLYMSRLAVPSMGFGVAYNMNSGVFLYGLNMNMTM
ncbi:MAG: hypothetical protein FWF22_09415 [Treponema sp.]|nr:hypothetical protein [Treponema sp.]